MKKLFSIWIQRNKEKCARRLRRNEFSKLEKHFNDNVSGEGNENQN